MFLPPQYTQLAVQSTKDSTSLVCTFDCRYEPSKDLDEQIQNSIHHPGEKAARDCWVQSQEEACTMQTIQDTQVLLNVMPKRISQRSNLVHDSLGTCVDMGSSGRMHA